MKKRIIGITLLILLLFNSTAYGFSDVDLRSWFYGDVAALQSYGVINGYEDDTFKPHSNVKNGEALKMIMEAVGIEGNPVKKGHWALGYLEKAMELGILANTFTADMLDEYITRQLVAELTVKALTLDIDQIDVDINTFKDTEDININMLYSIGIINGVKEGDGLYYKPDSLITRAEISAILVRIQDYELGLHKVLSDEEIQYKAQPFTLEELAKVFLYMASSGTYKYTVDYPNKGTSELNNPYYKEIVSSGFSKVYNGYPEYFSPTNRLTYQIAGTNSSSKVTFSLTNPQISIEKVSKMRKIFLEEATKIVVGLVQENEITKEMTETEKAKILFDKIVENVSYDWSLKSESFTGYGLIMNKEAVCQGYTATYNYMCKLLGLSVKGIAGSAGEDHMWTMARLDGKIAHIDVTWADSAHSDIPNYDYFMANSQFMRNTHNWDRTVYDI